MRKMDVGTAGRALLLTWVVQGCDAQVEPGYEGEPLTKLKGRVSALATSPAEADVGVLWLSDAEGQCSGPRQSCAYSASGAYSPDADADCVAACGAMPECVEVAAIEEWVSCQQACGVEIEVTPRVEYGACFTGGVGQTAPVTGDFPAQFSLDVLSPPPSETLLRSDTGERLALGFIVALEPNGGPFRLGTEEEEPPPWLLGGSETHILVYAADPIAADSSWGLYLGGAYSSGYHLVRVVFGNRCGLARLYPEDFEDSPDSEGGSASVPISDTGGDPERAAPEPEASFDEPDYRGVPFVCGNAVCEQSETCDNCSDCVACDAAGQGMSSGLSNLEGPYHCEATRNSLAPVAPGTEAEIELLIAPALLIDWPTL
jgi:hypothetical protein